MYSQTTSCVNHALQRSKKAMRPPPFSCALESDVPPTRADCFINFTKYALECMLERSKNVKYNKTTTTTAAGQAHTMAGREVQNYTN